ncbi:tetratricopeptide repeat protein [Myxococcaceae bacterium GXIMD 01537]
MASTHAREGGRLLQMGLPQDAVKSFQKGLSIDPKDLECLLGLLRAQLSLGATGEAEMAARRLLAVKPDHAEAQSHLAMLQARAGNPQALELLRTLAATPQAGYFERFNLASVLSERGDVAGAKAAYESALQVAPQSAHVHFELGRLSLAQEDTAGAVRHFQKSAELAPNEAMPLLLLSRAHAARGEVGLAIQVAQRAYEKAPQMRVILEDLFKLYLSAGSAEGARRCALELRRNDPNNANFAYMQGLAAVAAGQLAEAQGLFGETLKIAPGSWQARQALAQVHSTLGEGAKARELLKEAVAAAPTEPGPVNDYALLLMQDNAHAQARPLLEKALAAHPRDAGLHLNLALATFKLDRAASVRHAKQAQELGDSDLREQAARLLKQLGA